MYFARLFWPLLALLAFHSAPAFSMAEPIFSDGDGAIRGYDPVAYFTEGSPHEGSADFTHEWNGAVWHFVSAENRDTFAADPESYAPQYGGYCAWAASQGYLAPIDPDAWEIWENKLYLNFSRRVHRRWTRNKEENIVKADANWPGILE